MFRLTPRCTFALAAAFAMVLGLAPPAAADQAAPPSFPVIQIGAGGAESPPAAGAACCPTTATSAPVPALAGGDSGQVDLLDVYTGLPGGNEPAGVTTGPAPSGTSDPPSGVTAEVRDAIDADGTAPVVIRLREQVDMAQVEQQAALAGRAAAAAAARELQGQGGPAHAARVARDAAREARGQVVVDALQSTAAASQAGVRAVLASHQAAGRADDIVEFWIFNGFAATVDAAALDTIAAHPDVASVTLDQTILIDEPVVTDDGEPLLPIWSLENVNAPDAWGEFGVRGDGVVVGVMDTGVDGGHPALAASWRGNHGDPDASWFVPTGENYPQPGDGHGHGTHVTGSIVGKPPGEVTGVAPDAQWIAAKIFTDFGSTTDSVVHAGFQWMLAPGGDPSAAPHVVNNSWGSNATHRTEYWDAVAAWVAAGIVPVFANGNAGPGTGTVGSPASFPHAIGVGATDIDDRVAWFSSRGPAVWDGVTHVKPEISAPGYEIRSTWPTHLRSDGYHTISGTSMAAPHVAGVVALLLSAAPDLTIDEVRRALQDTATDRSHMAALPNAYGAGVVDAHAAVTHVAHSGTLTGTVTDTDGAPVAATIAVGDHRTTADASGGGYALRLTGGSHEVTVTAYGFAGQSHQAEVAVGGLTHLDVVLVATDEQSLTGTVSGPDGPVPDARVSLADTPVPATRTGSDGGFTLTAAEGSYDLHVSAGGFTPAVVQIDVDGATDIAVDLTPLALESAPGWSQYQNNPARTGRGEDSLAAATLQPVWTSTAGGQMVFSSPVIADGRVFVNTDNGRLVAHDLTTGEQVWTFAGGDAMRGAPAVSGGLVYTGGGLDGGIHAIDATTGDLVWRLDTPDRRTIYTAPVVHGGILYANTGFTPGRPDTLFALDPTDGTVIWSADIGTRAFFGAAAADGIVIATSAGGPHLTAFDAATGDVLWTLQREADEIVAAPSIADGTVYVTTSVPPAGFAPGWQGSLLAVDAATGDVQWEVASHGDGQGTAPAVHGDLVIAGSHGLGLIAAHDRATGAPVWHHGLPTNGAVSSSVMVSGDGYVVAGSQGDQRVFALDAVSGELVWEQPLGTNVLSSPAYAGGRLVIATSSGTLHAFHPTGQVRGVVTGPDGPLPATVRAVEADRDVTADADTGSYELAGLPPGQFTIEVSLFGFETRTFDIDVFAAQATGLDVTLAPVGNGALVGTVSDENGQPLPGATVTLSPTPLEPAVTGDGGGYGFDEVAAGTYQVVVDADGYARTEDSVTIVAGETIVADYTLERFDVAVVADFEGRVTSVLSAAGWRVDQVTFDEIVGTLANYSAVVVSGALGDRADADLDRFAQIVAEADAAGTSLVFLDTGGPSHGSIRTLSQVTGDPAEAPAQLSNHGQVWLEDVVAHPITAGLPDTSRVPLLEGGSWHAWFTGYTGHTLAVLGTDREGPRGGGIGYQRRTMDSNHVLLPVAPSPWAHWEPTVADLLTGAVDHAAQAAYGTVAGTVSDAGDDPLAATIEVVGGMERTVAGSDGGYQLLLEPGEHVLRYRFIGAQAVELAVTVNAGQVKVRDVALPQAVLGTITGRVSEEGSDSPISGATVTVTGAGLPPVTTGGDGGYVIEDVPGGSYDLEVSADGYESATVAGVDVVDGAVTTVDVSLARAPGVVVVGDRLNQISNFLESHSIPVEQAGWEVVDHLDGVEVVILHNPPNIGQEQFLHALAAFDEAGVSVIFPADGWNTRTRGVDLLVNHTGDPSSYGRLGGIGGGPIFLHDVVAHPLFEGVTSDPVQILNAASEAAFFPDYSGIVLAEVAEGDADPAGIGVAYDVRTPSSVHVLLSGLAATLRNHPESNWTSDGQRIFLNAVRWAAAPGVGGLSGTVTDAAGQPVPAAVVEVAGSSWSAVTDADGVFELGVTPGEHTLHYSAFGYVDAQRTVTVGADQTVDASMELAVGDVGGISGVVTSAEGGVLEGVRVDLRGTPYETHTGPSGEYVFDRVEPGSYELELETNAHVRTLAAVDVVVDAVTDRDVALRVTPRIGIIDDSAFTNSRDRGKEFLADWGYEAEDIRFDSLDRIGDMDLIVANVSDFNLDPGPEVFQSFKEEVNRAGVPVLWMGQHGRGAIQFLHEYHGDPSMIGQGFNDGTVTADVVTDHALVAGLPGEFDLMTPNGRYTFFDGFDGVTVADLVTGDDGRVGAAIAYRGRTAGTVDVLLSTMSVTTWGAPSTRQSATLNWTPAAERVFVNALDWALDAQGIGAEVRGTVTSDLGGTIASQVEVVETGRIYTGREGDGTFLVPLQPGTWTLSVSAFGHDSTTATVSVTAGDVVTTPVTLSAQPAGTVAGTVTGPDGAAVAGAQVRLLDTPLSATTGPDGGYTISQVPEGQWTIRVTADGFRAVQVPVTVTAGQVAPGSVQLPATSPIAVIDTTGSSVHGVSLAAMLSEEGYEVDLVGRANLATLPVEDYELIIFNAIILSGQVDAFRAAVDAAAAHGVSTIYASQFGANYPIGQLSTWRGDPAGVDWGFVSGDFGVDYVAHTPHPIFAGFPVGEQIELITSNLSNNNQQWGSFSGFSGQTIGHVHNRVTGQDLGAAVGYQFSSATSVEVLLGSLAAVTHGWPDARWTDNARRIYLNAVAWSLDATQAELTGVVTGDGGPVAGATVTSTTTGATAVTAADGTYALGLTQGEHTVTVSAFGFETATLTVDVPESGTVTLDVTLVPLPRGEVTGTVSSTTGEPVAGAHLVGDGPLEWTATTGTDGGFTAGNLLEGEYEVTVAADGHLSTTVTVTIDAAAPATLDVTLQPTVVGVLGDADGALTALLRQADVPATALEWEADLDLHRFEAVVVNGGSPDEEVFAAVIDAADDAQVSLVFTGTWAVDRGGIRLLEQFTERVTVGVQGFGDGPVRLTGFGGQCAPDADDCLADHPLFAGLSDDPATLIVEGGYYSVLESYTGVHGGWELADLHVDRVDTDPVTGLSAAWSWRTGGSIEVLLSASAVTEAVGPGKGWTADARQLIVNAVEWARQAALDAPAAPTLVADAPVTVEDSVTVSGTAEWPWHVTVWRDGVPVATAEVDPDGSWSAQVPLQVGDNTLTAVVTNLAGESAPSAPVTVSRWVPMWQVIGQGDARVVRLSLGGAARGPEPADTAEMVVFGDGVEVARVQMVWANSFYVGTVDLAELSADGFTVSAELEIGGFLLVIDGPELS
jgi:outer membrane protein assembly factor BamB